MQLYYPDLLLVDLNILEYSSNESACRSVAHCSAQESQIDRNQGHISEVEAKLQQTVHLELKNVVVDAIKKYIRRCGCP